MKRVIWLLVLLCAQLLLPGEDVAQRGHPQPKVLLRLERDVEGLATAARLG